METSSLINTSLNNYMIEGFAPKSVLPVENIGRNDYAEKEPQAYATEDNAETVDLTNYYNEVKPEDILTKTGRHVIESAQALDNTMVIAMQNGYSVQDVCNIRLAEMAYKASAYVFDTAREMTTFELDV